MIQGQTRLHRLRTDGRQRKAWVCLGLLLGAAVCGAQTPVADGPSAVMADARRPEAALPGQITGTVVDSSGAEVAGATVTLVTASGTVSTTAAGDGTFQFLNVPAGRFSVTVKAEGMEMAAKAGALLPGEHLELPDLQLAMASVATEVEAMSVHDQAEMEMGVEEHQRLLGVVPNYYVVYNWDAAPLSSKQKFKLALHNSIDPFNTGINAGVAGLQYWQNDFAGYGRGWSGYGKRFGANEADMAIGTMVGGAILPSILRQDPRYFYLGKGTVMHRFWYALSTAVICRGDNGKWQPNYSSIGGDVASGALANLYYPASDRNGASLTIEEGLLAAALDGVGNVAQEFLFKKFTPHAPKYASTTP